MIDGYFTLLRNKTHLVSDLIVLVLMVLVVYSPEEYQKAHGITLALMVLFRITSGSSKVLHMYNLVTDYKWRKVNRIPSKNCLQIGAFKIASFCMTIRSGTNNNKMSKNVHSIIASTSMLLAAYVVL